MTDEPSGHLPRLLTRAQAAAYCGYTPSGFSANVADGTLPGPVSGLARWDKLAIDRRLDELSGLVPVTQQQAAHSDLEAEKEYVIDQEWLAWEIEQGRRASRWPEYDLNKRQAKALDALGKNHPEPVASTVIAGAGNKSFEQLIAKGLATEHEPDRDRDRTFVLTGKGKEEYNRYLVRDSERTS